jgi:hypothetical protein
MQAMKTFEFLLILKDVERADSKTADALYEAGCDDGTLFSSEGETAIGFTRDAPSLEEAVRSAIANVTKAGYLVSRVEPFEAAIFERINQELSHK